MLAILANCSTEKWHRYLRASIACIVRIRQLEESRQVECSPLFGGLTTMPTVGLSAFLKLYSLDVKHKEREYKKYATKKGGYDFYWTLKDAAARLTFGKKPIPEAEAVFKSIQRASEIAHNKSGFVSLADWLSKDRYAFFPPPSTKFQSPKGFLTIKLEPEFGLLGRGGRRLVSLWNTMKPELTPQAAGVGIHLIESYLCIGECVDCKGMVLDLRKSRPYVTDAIPEQVKTALAKELNWVDNYFETLPKEEAA